MTTITADTSGATRLGRHWLGVARELDREVEKAKAELGRDAEPVFASHALRLTGRLARGIRAQVEGDQVLITAEAQDPETGFDYVKVTRFGQKKAKIRPTRRKAAASVISTRSGRSAGRRAALRLSIGGRVVYRRSVKAFRPRSDWAEDALPSVHRKASAASTRLGRRVEAML